MEWGVVVMGWFNGVRCGCHWVVQLSEVWLSWSGSMEWGVIVMGWSNGVRCGCQGVGQ